METKTYNFNHEHRLADPKPTETTVYRGILDRLVEQTSVVNEALRSGLFSRNDIHNLHQQPYDPYLNRTDEPAEIYEWVCLDGATASDIRRLDSAVIPHLTNTYGTWIGMTWTCALAHLAYAFRS